MHNEIIVLDRPEGEKVLLNSQLGNKCQYFLAEITNTERAGLSACRFLWLYFSIYFSI